MTKISIIFLLCIFSNLAISSRNSPKSETGIEYGVDFRILKKQKRNIFLFESKNRKELLNQNYHQFLAGSYYRLTKRLRFGLFFQVEQGLRWDEDWKKSTSWNWGRIQNRWDYSSVFDISYQDKINSKFLWEWKNRFFYYHGREAYLLKFRPGLRYFIFKNKKPFAQIYSQIETYSPINYGNNLLYEYWVYFGSLFEVSDKFSLGPIISYRQRWFHSYENFENDNEKSYKEKFNSVYYGLSAIIHF